MGSHLNGGKRKFYICEMKVLPNSTMIYIMCFLDCRFCPHVFKRFVDLFPISFIQIRPERLYKFIHHRARR